MRLTLVMMAHRHPDQAPDTAPRREFANPRTSDFDTTASLPLSASSQKQQQYRLAPDRRGPMRLIGAAHSFPADRFSFTDQGRGFTPASAPTRVLP